MKNLNTTDRIKNIAYPLATFIGLIILWELAVDRFSIPSYILPSPRDIYLEFVNDWQVLAMHSRVTLEETVIGLSLSVLISLFIGMIMDFVPFVKKCFHPIMYVTQMIPLVWLWNQVKGYMCYLNLLFPNVDQFHGWYGQYRQGPNQFI